MIKKFNEISRFFKSMICTPLCVVSIPIDDASVCCGLANSHPYCVHLEKKADKEELYGGREREVIGNGCRRR